MPRPKANDGKCTANRQATNENLESVFGGLYPGATHAATSINYKREVEVRSRSQLGHGGLFIA